MEDGGRTEGRRAGRMKRKEGKRKEGGKEGKDKERGREGGGKEES